MRATIHGLARTDPEIRDIVLEIGASVIRQGSGGGIELEFGPADGPAHIRLVLSQAEAQRLAAALRTVANGGPETVIISEG